MSFTKKLCFSAGTSRENINYIFEESTSRQSIEVVTEPNAPLARMSDICTLTSANSEAAAMEVICEHCNTVMTIKVRNGNFYQNLNF